MAAGCFVQFDDHSEFLRCRRAVDLSLGLDLRFHIFGEYKQEFVIQIPNHV